MKIDQVIDAISGMIDDAAKDRDTANSIADGLALLAHQMDEDPAYSFEQVNKAAGEANAAKARAELRQHAVDKLWEAMKALEDSKESAEKAPLLL